MSYAPATVLLDYQTTALRGNLVTPVVPSWPAKDPSELVTLSADFGLFAQSPADRITAVSVAAQDTALAVISVAHAGMVITLILAGGTAGESGAVTISVRLSNAQIITRAVLLPVIAQPGAPGTPPFPVLTTGEVPVTDPATGGDVIDPATGEFVVTT